MKLHLKTKFERVSVFFTRAKDSNMTADYDPWASSEESVINAALNSAFMTQFLFGTQQCPLVSVIH